MDIYMDGDFIQCSDEWFLVNKNSRLNYTQNADKQAGINKLTVLYKLIVESPVF